MELAGVRSFGFRQIPGELGGSSRNSGLIEYGYIEMGALLIILRELNLHVYHIQAAEWFHSDGNECKDEIATGTTLAGMRASL